MPGTPPGAAWVGGFSASAAASATLGPPENAPGSTRIRARATAAAAAIAPPMTTLLRPPRSRAAGAAAPVDLRAQPRRGAGVGRAAQRVQGDALALDDARELRRRGHARLDLGATVGRQRAVGEAREIGELVVAQPVSGFRFHVLFPQ